MATIIGVSGLVKEVSIPKEDSLAFLQDCVKGYIEWIWLADGRGMYINEEGKLHDLPINHTATELFRAGRTTSDYIVGDVVVLTLEETRKETQGYMENMESMESMESKLEVDYGVEIHCVLCGLPGILFGRIDSVDNDSFVVQIDHQLVKFEFSLIESIEKHPTMYMNYLIYLK